MPTVLEALGNKFSKNGIGLGTEYGLALLWPEFSDEFFRGTLKFDLQ